MTWYHRSLLVSSSLCLFLAVLIVGEALAAESDKPVTPEIAAIVQQLGDDSYEVRLRGSQRLAELGLKVGAALKEGLRDTDPEIRRRCRWILEDVLEADYEKRLQAFIDDTEGKQQHDLPGWERYRRVIGGDATARKLFVEMHRAESSLMISAAAGAEPAADSFKLRIRQVYTLLTNRVHTQRKPPSLPTVAALLFVSSNPRLDLPRELVDSPYLMSLVQQSSFQKALAAGDYKPSARKLLGQWILRPTGPNLFHSKLQFAVQHNIKEGLALALRAIKKKEVAAHLRIYAVTAVGQLGGKEHAATLASFLDDKTECSRRVVNGKITTIEIRDVALAWLIHLTGQSHVEYGQVRAKSEFARIASNRRHNLNVSYCGFGSAEKRQQALKKWKEYVKKNPLPKPPKEPAAEAANTRVLKPAAQPAVKLNPVAVALGFAVPAVADDGTVKEPQAVGLQTADRKQVRKLNLARKLCNNQRYGEALLLLDEILAAESDASFRPDAEVPLFCYLKPAAEHLIGKLPAKGHADYKLQFEPLAQELLGRAVEAGSAPALADVAGRFFYTRAGAEATYLLAVHHFNHGHPLHAALYLQRLRSRSRDAERFEPALSATLATCWYRTGMTQAAEEVLLRMQARYPGTTVRIAGERRKVFTRPEEALAWLESFIGPPQKPPAEGGWPMFRGGPTRNAPGEVGSPFLQAKSLTPMCAHPKLHQEVQKLRKDHLDQYRVALPRLHPLVVGETILLRTATHIRVLDFNSGKLLWESPLEDSLRHFLKGKNWDQNQAQADSFARGLQRRFWEDATFGTISSDGHCVYGVEDLSFGLRADFQRMVVMPDGRRRLDPGSLKNYNLLVAYDVKTGKVKWEIGGPSGVEMVEQAGTFFLGPPLPLGGRLYVLADVNNQTRLLELDAETGARITELTVAQRDQQQLMQMAMFTPYWPLDNSSRRNGISPSYADGVLVCYTPENHFAAIDLSTRAVLWVYRVPTREPLLNVNLRIAMMRGLYQAEQLDHGDRWADASVTIADGRVLLTPPGSDKLICLSLAGGRVQWSIGRRDGLYVGGVEQGNVIVIGRGSVWAVKLADGTPAWPDDVPLPPGALPSGRGFLGKDRYHLPLTTAEVAAVDLKQGRLVARSRSPDGIIPGNLVSCRDSVLSQNVDGFWRFTPLSARDRQLTATLRERPNDSQALADRGEVLLYEGKLAEAVEHLRRAMKLKQSPRTRQTLVDALVEGLHVDLDTFRGLAEQFRPLIDESDQRARFVQHLALALQRAGHLKEALKTYLTLIELEPDDHKLEHFGAAWVARRDRWIQARLAELCAAAPPDQRAEIDREISSQLHDDRLRWFLTYFGAHPAAHDARLRLAKQLAGKREWLEAERLLRHVLGSGTVAQQREAVARLAALLHAAKQPDEAARFYRHLDGELAETVCLDGKTGRELIEALPADDLARRRLATPDPWPVGKIIVEDSDKRSPNSSPQFPFTVMGEGGRFATRASVEMDMNGQKLVGRDAWGRPRWQVTLGSRSQPQAGVIMWGGRGGLGGWGGGFPGVALGSLQARLKGHLLAVRVGNRVIAIDGLGGKAKMLWSKEASTSKSQVPGMPVFIGGFFPGMPQQPKALPGSDPWLLAMTANCVCFQQERKLLAVEPLSGEVLWTRDDVRPGSDLFGDDEMLLVTPPDSTEAVVFNMLDGRELGRRRVPPRKTRMWTMGRKVVTWNANADKTRLTLTDPWTGKDVWQREFDAKAKPWLVEADEVAVLEPQGDLAVLALRDGNPTLSAKVDPAPSLQGIVMFRSANRYVLVANHSPPVANLQISYPYPAHLPVNGRLYGFDRKTGKRVWAADVADQALKVNQPGELPVLTFFGCFRKQEGNRSKTEMKLLCLDKRTGRELHSKQSPRSSANVHQVDADPENRRVEIRSYLGTAKITFTDEPPGDEPVKVVKVKEEITTPQRPRAEAVQQDRPGVIETILKALKRTKEESEKQKAGKEKAPRKKAAKEVPPQDDPFFDPFA